MFFSLYAGYGSTWRLRQGNSDDKSRTQGVSLGIKFGLKLPFLAGSTIEPYTGPGVAFIGSEEVVGSALWYLGLRIHPF